MSLNHYWEKYKNRNRSQDLIYPSNEKPVPNSLIYDHLSALQGQMNQLETKILDLNCKFNSLESRESFARPDPVREKVEILEKTLEIKSELETRFKIQKEAQKVSNSEALRSELIKELTQIEARISQNISKEVQDLNFRIKEINESVKEQKFKLHKPQISSNENKEDQTWQQKIEKIVIACAEKVKKVEIHAKEAQNSQIFEQIHQDIKNLKGFQIKAKRKIQEIEELSKKICRKMIESEINSLTASPCSRKAKLESSLILTSKKAENEKPRNEHSGYSSAKKIKNKAEKLETPAKKDKNKGLNRLEDLYNELSDL